MSAPLHRVVVGYDGSAGSQAALDWATTEAVRRHASLRIVEVFELVVSTQPAAGETVPLEALRSTRERRLQALAEGIRLQTPGLVVDPVLDTGSPTGRLLEETGHAQMLVLGSRGLGGWSGLIVGSVTVQLSAHAQCPVVVVPPEFRPHPHARPTVVVGVDGSKISAKAIDFAFDQAEALRARVLAVHAWTSPWLTYSNGQARLRFDEKEAREACRLLVAESVAGAVADHPDVPWETRLITGQPARAILQAAGSADLVVVGSRGHGGFAGLLLGSVSQTVLHHTPCPIAIVR